MAFSFDTYETFARGLKDSSEEVDLRNSVSRGYYCFYHKVKTFFGFLNSETLTIKALINKLKDDERFNKRAQLSMAMQIMKEEREQADYFISNNKNRTKINFNTKDIGIFWRKYDNIVNLLNQEDLD